MTRSRSAVEERAELVAGHGEVLPAVLLARLLPSRPRRPSARPARSGTAGPRPRSRAARRCRASSPARRRCPAPAASARSPRPPRGRAGFRRGVAARRRPGDGQRAQLARLDLVLPLADTGDAGRDLAAEDGRQRLAAAGEGDVVDLRRVDARPPGRSGRRGCGRCRRPSRRPRRSRSGSAWKAAIRSSSVWYSESAGTTITSNSAVRLEIGVVCVERHRRLVGGDGADHHQTHHHQVVVVAGLVVDELGEADRAAGPLDVEDLDASATMPSSCSTRCISRAVVSQPPPGAAGAMISIGVSVKPSMVHVACAAAARAAR